MDPIRVGVAGCGQIAQIMHLPFLTELPQFAVTAIYDHSPTAVAAVGDRFGVPVRCTDYRELVERDDVDAVAVLTMEHEEVVVAAAEAGKHIFTEKPVEFTLAAVDRVIAAVERASVTAMVGYMKRYDPGYELGAARMREMTDLRLIRAHDFAADFNAHLPLWPSRRRSERRWGPNTLTWLGSTTCSSCSGAMTSRSCVAHSASPRTCSTATPCLTAKSSRSWTTAMAAAASSKSALARAISGGTST